MTAISRREFFRKTGTHAAVAAVLTSRVAALRANPLGMPIGCQTWPVRTMIAKDFPGTIKTLADAGFQRIELCSPVGYADSGFGDLAKYKGAELRKILGDAGVSCESSHFGIEELRDNLSDRIAWAKDVGLTQMMVPSLDGPKNPTMDDVKRAADEYNKMAEQSAKAGIQQGLHNERFELSQGGTAGGPTDPARTAGPEARQVPVPGARRSARATTPPSTSRSIRAGSSPCTCRTGHPRRRRRWRWVRARSTGRRSSPRPRPGGVKNYFVEMNLDLMQASVPYLKELNV